MVGESARSEKLTIGGLIEVFEDWVGHDEKGPLLKIITFERVVIGG
jgi:hypothetical protein